MRRKLQPGHPSSELPFPGEEHEPGPLEHRPRAPLAPAHPESLRARAEAPSSAASLPGLDGLGARPFDLSSAPFAPPRPPGLSAAAGPHLRPDSLRTELPMLAAMGERASAPGGHPQGPRATGTTTLGLTAKDVCILGTDHRASAGRLVSHTDTQKLFRIDNHLGLTIAGLVGDAQDLVRTLTSEAKLFSMKQDRPMPVAAAAARMANLLNQHKFSPFEVALIVGGFDKKGPQVFSLDEAGGSIPDKWTTTGSGSRFVYGVLEDQYRDNMTPSDALDAAIRGLNAATRRDSASGNGFDLATIDKNGFQWVPREEVDKRLKKMGLPPIPK